MASSYGFSKNVIEAVVIQKRAKGSFDIPVVLPSEYKFAVGLLQLLPQVDQWFLLSFQYTPFTLFQKNDSSLHCSLLATFVNELFWYSDVSL